MRVIMADTKEKNSIKCSRTCLTRITAFFSRLSDAFISQPHQYESPRRLFGLPLLTINLGPSLPGEQIRHARGVVAFGNSACGIIAIGMFLAKGIIAVAPLAAGVFCVGVACLGLLSVAVLGIGLISVSILAFGYIAIGILAIGYKAVGIVALGRDCIGILAIGKTVRTLIQF